MKDYLQEGFKSEVNTSRKEEGEGEGEGEREITIQHIVLEVNEQSNISNDISSLSNLRGGSYAEHVEPVRNNLHVEFFDTQVLDLKRRKRAILNNW